MRTAKQPARASSGRYVSRLTSGTLAVIMAGGRGERLRHSPQHRCKPAAPFGGKFRIIDFVLSNCVNSGIRQICVLTQYKAHSLIQHMQRGWGYLRGEFGEFVEMVPAQQQLGEHWYRAPRTAVYQNLDLIRAHRPKHVLVLAGDHIYKMDYGPMIAFHVEKGADITVGVVEVPLDEAREFGVLTSGPSGTASPVRREAGGARADAGPAATWRSASMGIYVFNTRLLEKLLLDDAADRELRARFRQEHHPAGDRRRCRCSPIRSSDVQDAAQNYWRDVGTVDAYYEANMELVRVSPELNIYDEEWPIWTYQEQLPPAKFVFDDEGRRGMRDRLDGVGRLHHLGRAWCAIAAVLERARGRALDDRPLGDPAARAHRQRAARSARRSSTRAAACRTAR